MEKLTWPAVVIIGLGILTVGYVGKASPGEALPILDKFLDVVLAALVGGGAGFAAGSAGARARLGRLAAKLKDTDALPDDFEV
jgi:hypothetical protein